MIVVEFASLRHLCAWIGKPLKRWPSSARRRLRRMWKTGKLPRGIKATGEEHRFQQAVSLVVEMIAP